MTQPSKRLTKLMHKNLQRGSRKYTGGAVQLRIPKTFLLLFTLLVGGLLCFNYGNNRVVHVSDGDTITVFRSGSFERIRLYGVDCPESGQSWGTNATDFAEERLLLREVRIIPIDLDQYGRTVALVELEDGKLMNEELIRNGHAWVYRAYCREAWCPSWLGLEQQAKAKKLGLWAQKKPQAPWEWRKYNSRY